MLAIFPFFRILHLKTNRKERGCFMTFGEKLALLRKENNYTQEQLAELLQVSRQSISKWESNLSYPETDRLVKMGKLFSCSMDYLLNDEITQRTPAVPEPAPEEDSGLYITIRKNGVIYRRPLKERKSETMVFGMPLYHIGKNARGFFALGLKARGVFSIGLFSTGVFSFGFCSVGLVAFGVFALGGIALGAFSAGILALGAICFGLITIGALSVGCFSLGAAAVGRYLAVGDEARALVAIGKSDAVGSLAFYKTHYFAEEAQAAQAYLQENVPSLLQWALQLVQGWLKF